MKFTKDRIKERILVILFSFVILLGGSTTTTLVYGLPQQGTDGISSHYNSGIKSRDGNDNYNYKNIGALGSFPSVEAGQPENTIIDSNTTNTNNNNTKVSVPISVLKVGS